VPAGPSRTADDVNLVLTVIPPLKVCPLSDESAPVERLIVSGLSESYVSLIVELAAVFKKYRFSPSFLKMNVG
jgi:hypothetical protein